MVIEILILALLDRGPRHGYEIKKSVEGILRRESRLNNNLLYPALRSLAAEGCIALMASEDREGSRKTYELTETGRARLAGLLVAFGDAEAESDDEFLARLAFFDRISAADRSRIIGLRERALERKSLHAAMLDADFAPAFDSPWVREILSMRRASIEAELSWTKALRSLAAGAGIAE
jgi:DNA-binding PadR family transcriptional regulator